MIDRPLAGRVALVTGANHGIGQAVAVELARLGADTLTTFFRPPYIPTIGVPPAYDALRQNDGEGMRQLVEQAGARCHVVEADLTEPDTIGLLFDLAEEHLGAVSILVNNASGWRQDTFSGTVDDQFGRPMEEVAKESFDANFLVDARASALLISEFAHRHRLCGDTWGRIVGLSSGGDTGFPDEVSYGAAKAALENYTMSAASELAGQGITANVVYPPITDTGWVTDEVRTFAARAGTHVATPAEVAGVVGWLCTDAARLVTGNRIRMR